MRGIRFGQVVLAVAAASLAVLSLAYGDFAPGGESLPAWIPWRQTWAYLFGFILLAASIGVCVPRTAPTSALAIIAYGAVWALISAPQILSQPLGIGAWYPLSEALTSLVGAWILHEMLRHPSGSAALPIAPQRAMRAAHTLFGLTCIFYGVSHFAYAGYTATMVPAWLPAHLGLAYLTGVGHVAAGVAIIVGVLPQLAATLEAIMMTLFGLLVWLPSFFAQPLPKWAISTHNQWSEVVVNIALAAAAWIVATSLKNRPAD